MASYAIEYKFTLTDVNGDNANMSIRSFGADTTTMAQLATTSGTLNGLIAACTNAKITSASVSFLVLKAQISAGTAPPPANATYPSVTDGAALDFNNSGGGKRRVVIPAPLESDFKVDTNTVNPADANVGPLITELEALTDIFGTTNLYQGGVKTGRHARRRPTRKSL